jgi:hypothetical protein
MNNSLTYPLMPAKRSGQATSAQRVPTTASTTSETGSQAAGRDMIRRSPGRSSVGISASSSKAARMPVAEVDHGSETASATARPSATRAKCLRSNAMAFIDQLSSAMSGDSCRPNFLCPDN